MRVAVSSNDGGSGSSGVHGLSLPCQRAAGAGADRVRGAAAPEPLLRGALAGGWPRTERLARRMDAADREFMEAVRPLQGLYRALVTAHGAHRDVEAQRGEAVQELSMELAVLRGASAARDERIRESSLALAEVQAAIGRGRHGGDGAPTPDGPGDDGRGLALRIQCLWATEAAALALALLARPRTRRRSE